VKLLAGALLIGVAACRFGGPSADPAQYVAFADASAEVGTGVGSSDDASIDADLGTGSDATTDATPDVAETDDTGTASDGAVIGPSPEGSTGASCTPTAAVCDPVHNTGCNPLQQCDVDPTQTQTPTGLCLFYSSADAATCLATAFTESCAQGSTCVGGACRAVCYCDSDCPVGQCCPGTSHAGPFRLCESCE
jgi:hypothetical protein